MKARPPRQRAPLAAPQISLLWPGGPPPPKPDPAPWEADLGLAEIVAALTPSARYAAHIRQVLTTFVLDPAVITWRQAILADFIANPPLVEAAAALLPRLAALQQGNPMLGKRERNLLLETADHVSELEAFIEVVQALASALQSAALHAPALRQLRQELAALIAQDAFQALREDLPELAAPLRDIRSITIGVNLDADLKPEGALLLAINSHRFADRHAWLDRVLGARQAPDDESGVADLHSLPDDPAMRPLSVLYQDLDRLLTQTAAPVARALRRCARASAASLAYLEYEIAFFTAAARLLLRLRGRGLPICQPEIAPPDERIMSIEGLANLSIALRTPENAVPNDADFGPEGRIAVLTGPNSGGKTTYLRSLGAAQVLAQAGLFLPARRARLSPVESLLTHFPALETRQEGRLEEESIRLRELFRRASGRSFVLLNETFSSTSSGEALYLAQDILAALRAIGARAVFATHLIELVERLDEIEAAAPGDCRLFSLVAGVALQDDAARPTYRIERGLPLGRSYAQEIARKHGISLAQLLAGR